jgi:hypothetical protein
MIGYFTKLSSTLAVYFGNPANIQLLYYATQNRSVNDRRMAATMREYNLNAHILNNFTDGC